VEKILRNIREKNHQGPIFLKPRVRFGIKMGKGNLPWPIKFRKVCQWLK